MSKQQQNPMPGPPVLEKRFLIAFVLLFVAAFIWLGIFTHEAPRVFLNQHSAVKGLTALNVAERYYAAQHSDVGYACSPSDLGEQALAPGTGSGLVDRVLASGTRSGYHFEIQCPQDSGKKVTLYTITALPQSPGISAYYALCTDQGGEIWYSENGSASDCLAMHKPIEQKYR